MEEDKLKAFKPEGPEYRYLFCVYCDKPSDGTMLMQEFGLCRECCQKLLNMVPEGFYAHVGRLLLYASKKQLILGDAKDTNIDIKKLGVEKSDKNIHRHGRFSRD
jgi:hypothetical protein